jgi:hypothetical protein
MLSLTTIIALLFAGNAAVIVFGYRRPQQTRSAALVATLLLLVLWPFLLGQIPVSYDFISELESGLQTAFQWRVDETNWLLSLSLLLLQFAALLSAATAERRQSTRALLILLLASALHFAFWATSLPAIVFSWTILLALWLAATWLFRDEENEVGGLLPQMALALTALVALWWAASGPDLAAITDSVQLSSWSTAVQTLALLAVLVQVVLIPLYLWRTMPRETQQTVAGLLLTAPIAAGAMLLARLEGASNIGLAFALPLSLIGLLGLLLACWHIWSGERGQWRMASALIIAQASLILLGGIWAGPQAVLAETRVLLLGAGLLLLAPSSERDDALPQIGPLLALLALVGLPLTAGFSGRSALYEAWLEQERWILLLVSALLHTLLAMAAARTFLNRRARTNGIPQMTPETLLPLAASLFPALALLSIARLTDTPVLAWIAILLPIIAGSLLAYFVGDLSQLRPALREAFSIKIPALQNARAHRFAPRLGQALREAASILEGEGGLLWLLLFLVILWLAR